MQVLLMTPESTPVSGDAGLVTRHRNAIDAVELEPGLAEVMRKVGVAVLTHW